MAVGTLSRPSFPPALGGDGLDHVLVVGSWPAFLRHAGRVLAGVRARPIILGQNVEDSGELLGRRLRAERHHLVDRLLPLRARVPLGGDALDRMAGAAYLLQRGVLRTSQGGEAAQ